MHVGIGSNGEVLAVFEGWVVEAWAEGRVSSGPIAQALGACSFVVEMNERHREELGSARLDRIARAHRSLLEGIYGPENVEGARAAARAIVG